LKKIALLVSVGRHPVSGSARYSRNDAAALALAQTLSKQHGAQLDVLHVGDAKNPALSEYLALGATRVEVLEVAGEAADEVVRALAYRLRGYDVVLTGTRAEAGMGSGMLPYQVAAALNMPLLNDAVGIDVDSASNIAHVRQFLPKGVRRHVAASLPAVIAVHPMANAAPRYAYAGMRAGRIDRVPVHAELARLGATSTEKETWQWQPATAKPVRLAAAEKRSGHARMLSATTTESRGGRVVIEGSPVEKAQVILAYLREHQLVGY